MTDKIQTIVDELNANNAQLFDVRENDEWLAGHLVQAELVPLSGLQLGQLPKEFDKSQKTYLHCRSGVRVYSAAPILEQMGFEQVIPLDEGFEELVREGVERAS